ncbi:divalent-cation tolerance protein CutA [Trinickia soli]|uniref:Cytochrome C biogenesis protein n=1 Tax=Trinickia soli TaxID=380675 RepID=A0A2N7VYY4_9BURK|nr:divalent-cation tolerance protein CutA [Trinickia soli]KAA0088188.1 divalent-cation tolerance protein CutA [Paraburkholderia sp. T12-10]PMS22345.1 cytochrome C biogenesis protein [Trinickia soli]CAB3704413.1 Divalent-cation tolerance protein CutA [Trinickia soli]
MLPPVVLVLTTLPDADSAQRLAEAALDERLAACVTELGAVRSRYRWKGQIETADEIQLLFKTSVARSYELEQFILANHPYETPEVLSWQAAGSAGYAQWVETETHRPTHV